MADKGQDDHQPRARVRLLGHVLGLQQSVQYHVLLTAPSPVQEVLKLALEGLGLRFSSTMWNEYAIIADGQDIRYLKG